jgi:hypothetical protein
MDRQTAHGMKVMKSALTLEPMPRLFLRPNSDDHDVAIVSHAPLLVFPIAFRAQSDDRRA